MLADVTAAFFAEMEKANCLFLGQSDFCPWWFKTSGPGERSDALVQIASPGGREREKELDDCSGVRLTEALFHQKDDPLQNDAHQKVQHTVRMYGKRITLL